MCASVSKGKFVKIGCSSGFWGDSPTAAAQLVNNVPDLQYLVSDYLAEVTMTILARAKTSTSRKGAGEGGYVKEFLDTVWKPLMKQIIERKIRVVTNAGGMNPLALKKAIEQTTAEAGLTVPLVAAITGDDLLPVNQELREKQAFKKFSISGEDEELWPDNQLLMSCNAYIGARPIAEALQKGAQVVITGRCVDSAIALGPLLYEFGWKDTNYDLLSCGSLAGHIIECGCQATGGNFTDWKASCETGWSNVGFPVVECFADGSFVVTKPLHTGGMVTKATVSEQMVYEIHDPGAYILPDVICDWRNVKITELPTTPGASGKYSNRVLVEGAKGRPPTAFYKVSATTFDGFKLSGSLMIGGIEAAQKAKAVGEAILTKTRRIFKERGIADFTETNIEVLGAEHTYGPHSKAQSAREIILRISVRHTDQKALEVLTYELAPAALAMAPGITGSSDGRPRPSPVIRYYSCLIQKDKVPITSYIGSEVEPTKYCIPIKVTDGTIPGQEPLESSHPMNFPSPTKTKEVPLIALCYGRSGDKGDTANIGIIARDPQYFPLLKAILTEETVGKYLAHLMVKGKVTRYELPGICALNFVLTHSLGSGGVSSLRMDRQGKAYAQMLLDFPVSVPLAWFQNAKL